MTTLIMIRHGETNWNVTGRYQGQADPPLNSKGIEQARQLAEKLADVKIELIFTSPLQRAAQTAQIIATHLQIPVYTDMRFAEIHQGDWQSRLRSEIENLYPDLFERWETEPWQVTPPGGEPLLEVQKRVFAAVDDIIEQYPTQHVGLVTHRIPIALIKIRYQSLDPDIIRTIHLPNVYTEEIHIGE